MLRPRLADLKGLWQRSMLVLPDGRRDTTTRVHWLQGERSYIDLRQPVGIPGCRRATHLDDLSRADCAVLAGQEGFAGRLHFDGRHFEWLRRIDYQPASAAADAGSLEWQGDLLVERGRDLAYVEHWHRDAAAATGPCAAAVLRDAALGTRAMLVRVGGTFMFARDRAAPLPAYTTLSECVAAAPDVGAARALIDCEISLGVVAAAEFRITASTLPYRVGALLGQSVAHATLTAASRTYEISEFEGDTAALGPSI